MLETVRLSQHESHNLGIAFSIFFLSLFLQNDIGTYKLHLLFTGI